MNSSSSGTVFNSEICCTDRIDCDNSTLNVRFGPQGVSRLPSEIWRRILALLNFRSRLCTTHVCHGLRQCVLETASFWLVLDLRCPNVPDSRVPDAQGRWGELTHSKHSHREGFVRWMAAQPQLGSLPPRGNPLRHVNTICLPNMVFDDIQMSFPSLIDCQTAPALTSLDLCGVSGRFAHNLVSDLLRACSQTLKTLLLCDVPGSVWEAPRDLMWAVCNDSQCMPRLEVFDLSGSFCYPSQAVRPEHATDFCEIFTSFCPRLHTVSVGYRSEQQLGHFGWPAACIMAGDDLIDSPLVADEPESPLFERLVELRVHGAPQLSDEGILFGARLKRGSGSGSGSAILSERRPLPLRTLVIPYASQVTASGLGALLPHCPLLTTLNIRASGAGGAISTVAACCPHLTCLNASCTEIDPTSIRELAHGCRALQELDLCYAKETGASRVGGIGGGDVGSGGRSGFDIALVEAVQHVCNVHSAESGAPLRMLGLGGFRALRDEHMRAILSLCPALDHLGIGGCAALSHNALDLVGELSPQLTSLNAHELCVAGADVIERLLDRCPALHSIDFTGVAASSSVVSDSCDEAQFQFNALLEKLAESHPYQAAEDRLTLAKS